MVAATQEEPLVTLEAQRADARRCPFANAQLRITLRSGDCVHLRGPTGAGKSTLCGCLAGLQTPRGAARLGVRAQVRWRDDVPPGERVGALFQSTTLIDSLSVAANVALALDLRARRATHAGGSTGVIAGAGDEAPREAKRLLEAVGLDFARDGPKMPGELSGGMARRASLALQLAQRKHALVLDEPFTGLDREAAEAVARELRALRDNHGVALLLVSHQPDLVALVHDAGRDSVVTLEPAAPSGRGPSTSKQRRRRPRGARSLRAYGFSRRFGAKVADYLLWSLPLIALAFAAAGLAVSALLADLLQRVDVRPAVRRVLDSEVSPLVKQLLGADAGPLQVTMTMLAVQAKAESLVQAFMPPAKAALYAQGLAALLALELGPLLTGLLLAGRIGGAYAGEVATMESSAQNRLLATLGASPRRWTLVPAAAAAGIAAPILSAAGTWLALALAGAVGESYGLEPPMDREALAAMDRAGDGDVPSTGGASCSVRAWARAWLGGTWYWSRVRKAVFPDLRVRAVRACTSPGWYSCSLTEACVALGADLVEVTTWPPIHHLLKTVSFTGLTLAAAELLARRGGDLAPREVPRAITGSVVAAGVVVIVADWGWSRLLLLREGDFGMA